MVRRTPWSWRISGIDSKSSVFAAAGARATRNRRVRPRTGRCHMGSLPLGTSRRPPFAAPGASGVRPFVGMAVGEQQPGSPSLGVASRGDTSLGDTSLGEYLGASGPSIELAAASRRPQGGHSPLRGDGGLPAGISGSRPGRAARGRGRGLPGHVAGSWMPRPGITGLSWSGRTT